MVRNAMRGELAELLKAPPGSSRNPVIRRSLKEEWLYATDLPLLYGGTVPETLTEEISNAGWEYEQEAGWLQLRKPAPEPPEGWHPGTFGPEAACCLSLLKRHPSHCSESAEAVQRILIKAGEEGSRAYEEACAALHREWAGCLRRGVSLPAVSRLYFEA